MFSFGSPLTLTPTLSPGPALSTVLWCISMEKHFPETPVGAKTTFGPGLSVPCSTRPVMTSPTPLILYTPDTGIRSGFLVGRFGTWTTLLSASRRVTPSTSFFFWLDFEALPPWHVGRFFNQVVSFEARHWDERNLLGLETNLGKHLLHFLFDFLVSVLAERLWLSGVHLVDTNDDLFDTQKMQQSCVLTGLPLHFSLLVVSFLD